MRVLATLQLQHAAYVAAREMKRRIQQLPLMQRVAQMCMLGRIPLDMIATPIGQVAGAQPAAHLDPIGKLAGARLQSISMVAIRPTLHA
eukprot:5389782-Amphidinium_carterae.1